jgi:hypothetical protein
VYIDEDVGSALNLFTGQTIFGAAERGSRRLFFSPLRLNPQVSYFRVFLEDIRGSLSSITNLFSERNINILSSGAFGFGNIWVSEFLADFKSIDTNPEEIVNEIEAMGGFVVSREITELFPRAFELNTTYKIKSDDGRMAIELHELPGGGTISNEFYAIQKAWPEVQALFLDFISSERNLLRISTRIKDVPGSLSRLAELLGTQVNMHAIHEQHHDEASGGWTIYGVLEIGTIEELKSRVKDVSTILDFIVEPLGWNP